MANVLEIVDLRTEFHLRTATVGAVDGVSFTVNEGECLGLVGESGCGKSTAGLSIMKLLPNVGHITRGSVTLLGRELVKLPEKQMREVRGNDVAMIFQDRMPSLNPTMTVGRQIAEPVRIHKHVSKQEATDRAIEVLQLVGMPRPAERLASYPNQLSGGLRRGGMSGIGRAWEPKLLIADEPTTARDVTIQAQILDLIDELRDRLKMAVLLITHDMGVIAGRTDRVMVMYAGKIVESAPTRSLFSEMRHPYSEALLDSIPKLNADAGVPLYSIPGVPPDLSGEFVGCRFEPRCRNATEQCRVEEPSLVTEAGHSFACFNPVGSATAPRRALRVVDAAEASRIALQRVNELTSRKVIVEIDRLVQEVPVTAGAVLQRKIGSVKAVSDVSFSVREGETFGLVGESGCGKTTIGRLVVALERPTSGAIRFDGQDVTKLNRGDLRRGRRDFQIMFQDPYASLDPRMRVGTILREPLKVQGIGSKTEQWERVGSLLREVGLGQKAIDLYPHEFSGGQRQRIGFARALTLNPRLIVADEPVSALDVSIQSQILNMMKALQQTHRLTYIVISHDLAVLRYLSDRIAVLYLGKLVEIGASKQIYEQPAHPYTRGLIDTIPVPDPVIAASRRGHHISGELPSAITPPSGCRFRTRCPQTQELCAAEEPPLLSFGGDHLAACHFPLQQPVGSAPMAASASTAPPGP